MGNTIPITLTTPHPSDLPLLSRLDISANASHPLISQSFTYPFQALKLFLSHLQFCLERKEEYRIYVARLSSRSQTGLEEGNLKLRRSGSADSGVDVSPFGGEEEEDDAKGEIVGFIMWRHRSTQQMNLEDGIQEWDWISQLPKGADMKLWKRYTELMSSDAEVGQGDVEVLKLAVLPRYQGRGIGTRLLQALLSKVEAEAGPRLQDDAPVIRVRASRNAKALYEKFGWGMVKEYTLDLREWGRARAYVNYEMVRDA